MDVTVRELKARLSEYLKRVEAGEVIGVTNRGRRVARILPEPRGVGIEQGLKDGWLTREADEPPVPVVPIAPRAGAPSSTAVIRADRDA
jgi:prevent-host-death family protein